MSQVAAVAPSSSMSGWGDGQRGPRRRRAGARHNGHESLWPRKLKSYYSTCVHRVAAANIGAVRTASFYAKTMNTYNHGISILYIESTAKKRRRSPYTYYAAHPCVQGQGSVCPACTVIRHIL